jgi:hypothetical protein
MKIHHFDRANIRDLEAAVNRAVALVAADYGLAVNVTGRSYSSEKVPFTVNFQTLEARPSGVRVQEGSFLAQCAKHGLDPTKTGYDGYTLVGWSWSRPKFPWDIKDGRGQLRKATLGWPANNGFRGVTAPPIPVRALKPAPQPGDVIGISVNGGPMVKHTYDGQF